MERGLSSVVKEVTAQDRFAAMTRGFEVVLGENARVGPLLQELREIRHLFVVHVRSEMPGSPCRRIRALRICCDYRVD